MVIHVHTLSAQSLSLSLSISISLSVSVISLSKMSINQYSSDLPEAYWWTQQQQLMELSAKNSSSNRKNLISQPNSAAPTFWSNSQLYHSNSSMFCSQNTALGFNLNAQEDEDCDEQLTDERENHLKEAKEQLQEQEIPKEPLFEKPLTPSDVGKLNRLVIPKQHAEKYFPLNGGDSGEKGFLLGFEDELGKSWRFRYSYWNSSQSYVLTKGWSRFVKDKRLDAGDIVLFQRHRLDFGRLFIGWRRKNAAPPAAVAGGGGVWTTQVFYSGHPYPSHLQGTSLSNQPDSLRAGSAAMQNNHSTTTSGNSKKLRLFGVNLEYQAEESEPSTPDGSPMSSQCQAQFPCHQHYPRSHSYNHRQSHMDINFTGDFVFHRHG